MGYNLFQKEMNQTPEKVTAKMKYSASLPITNNIIFVPLFNFRSDARV